MSKDYCLIDILNNPNDDIFTLIAQEIFETKHPISSLERKRVKSVCYGIIYGMGITTLSEELDITVEDAEIYITKFKNIFIK
jgi:DNA polymerase-1